MPKISVIIPCFNAEGFLKECLESLLNQSFKDIEVIAINDGSSDDTLDILNKFASIDSRITIIDQQNSGASAARNAGIKASNGKFIMFLDSDDFLSSNEILHKLYNIALNLDADLVFGDFNYYKNGEIRYQKNYICDEGIVDKEQFLFDYFTLNPSKSTFPTVCAKIIKTEILKNNNLEFLKDVFIAEDANLNAKIIWLANKIAKLNDPIYNYRIGDNNSSKKFKFKHFTDVRAAEMDLRNFFSKFNLLKTQKAYLECYFLILRYNAALTMKPYSFDDYEKAMEFACADIKNSFKSDGFTLLNKKLKILFYLYKFSCNYKIYAKLLNFIHKLRH
ncbi:glycosyltransferase family 2 protein [Campylobacter fetus]|uniref:Glycosyl transferase n=1 Tax=Campylobacter fetus subsp. testudinum TaxID=1507806 RepID=A0AAX0HBW4_CAMFE|nr:glycosyltransferase family 2 protein [Campylobacter fetus]AGZ81759.1 glycosyltransferase, family 2 [Campylobacter fetus subsp. testudinum 03-427]EAI4321263.1 glycosyltransferase family 2 protein [Campylobacter fetus]EAI4390520.1 glycosyltransferase family 2 protein [Campylobacter fetus]OCR90980.1 glycosyl transferase [Campylobacter fetus subsp. testudinum]OCS07496.1 glycosyl transferase [Campylobacter fetus subsp. testudinum]